GDGVAGARPVVDERGFAEQGARLEVGERELAVGGLALDPHRAALDEIDVLRRLPFPEEDRLGGIAVVGGARRELGELLRGEVGEEVPLPEEVFSAQGPPIVAEAVPSPAVGALGGGFRVPTRARPRPPRRPVRSPRTLPRAPPPGGTIRRTAA